MNTIRIRALLVFIAAIILSGTTFASPSDADLKFSKFRREMLPLVGQKVAFLGSFRIGVRGWMVQRQDWYIYVPFQTEDKDGLEKINALQNFNHHKVKATGILRHHDIVRSNDPFVSSIEEYFYIDVSDVEISDDERDGIQKSEAK